MGCTPVLGTIGDELLGVRVNTHISGLCDTRKGPQIALPLVGDEFSPVCQKQLGTEYYYGGPSVKTYGIHKNLPGIYLTIFISNIWSH